MNDDPFRVKFNLIFEKNERKTGKEDEEEKFTVRYILFTLIWLNIMCKLVLQRQNRVSVWKKTFVFPFSLILQTQHPSIHTTYIHTHTHIHTITHNTTSISSYFDNHFVCFQRYEKPIDSNKFMCIPTYICVKHI